MRYRRAFLPGGSWFFTVVTERRRPLLAGEDTVAVLRNAFRHVRASRPFDIDAIVVMPDHIHAIWTLPPGDGDFATRWLLVKTWFTKHCDVGARPTPNLARQEKQQQAIWQHRYWEHLLKDQDDFNRHVDYVHYNPVRHGYVARPGDWPYSSFHRAVRMGIHPRDWGAEEMDFRVIGSE